MRTERERTRSHPSRTATLRLVVILTVIFSLVLAGCSGSPTPSSAASAGTSVASTAISASPAATPKAGPILVGASLSLSGEFSDQGKVVQQGYELWAKYVNSKGGLMGRQVELRILSDGSSPEQIVTNYEQLITRDKVDLLLGPFSTGLS
jgi:branched-chain amino acid transport system substrate-binding protein